MQYAVLSNNMNENSSQKMSRQSLPGGGINSNTTNNEDLTQIYGEAERMIRHTEGVEDVEIEGGRQSVTQREMRKPLQEHGILDTTPNTISDEGTRSFLADSRNGGHNRASPKSQGDTNNTSR